ncbi:MAG: 2Fe-2S iron-sulfur cluster-binding protein [Dehalococcoidia bacterium]
MADQTPPSIIVDYGHGLRVTVPRGASVLEASKQEGVAHAAACDGDARCSTCRVLVEEGAEHCPELPAGESRAGAPIGWWAARPRGRVRRPCRRVNGCVGSSFRCVACLLGQRAASPATTRMRFGVAAAPWGRPP